MFLFPILFLHIFFKLDSNFLSVFQITSNIVWAEPIGLNEVLFKWHSHYFLFIFPLGELRALNEVLLIDSNAYRRWFNDVVGSGVWLQTSQLKVKAVDVNSYSRLHCKLRKTDQEIKHSPGNTKYCNSLTRTLLTFTNKYLANYWRWPPFGMLDTLFCPG